jgi:hypothetical protein
MLLVLKGVLKEAGPKALQKPPSALGCRVSLQNLQYETVQTTIRQAGLGLPQASSSY